MAEPTHATWHSRTGLEARNHGLRFQLRICLGTKPDQCQKVKRATKAERYIDPNELVCKQIFWGSYAFNWKQTETVNNSTVPILKFGHMMMSRLTLANTYILVSGLYDALPPRTPFFHHYLGVNGWRAAHTSG
jgi:hypothetical protein